MRAYQTIAGIYSRHERVFSPGKPALCVLLFLKLFFAGCQTTEVRETYFDDNQLQSRGYIIVNEDGSEVPHGSYVEHFKTGVRATKGSFVRGVLDGVWTMWHENGVKRREIPYNMGKYDGVFREWDEQGQLRLEAHFAGGGKHGAERRWRANGVIEWWARYEKGGLVRYITYDQAGEPIREFSVKQGFFDPQKPEAKIRREVFGDDKSLGVRRNDGD